MADVEGKMSDDELIAEALGETPGQAVYPQFDTWPGFGLIMELGPEREWWDVFWESLFWENYDARDLFAWYLKYINPPVMKSKLAEFLRRAR